MASKDKENDLSGYVASKLLIAMPQMEDPRFARTVVYMCAHTADGAMGLVVNKLVDAPDFPDLLEQLGIEYTGESAPVRIHFGGPVEVGRGFVLHSSDYQREGTLLVADDVGLTATVDILRAIADGAGPARCLLALGYSGWGPGQLEREIQQNGWLVVAADDALLFDADLDSKWVRSIDKLGIDLSMLSGEAGQA